MTDKGLASLSTLGSSLKTLIIKGISVEDKAFQPLLASLHSVRVLSLRACLGLTDASLSQLSRENSVLKTLSLSGCTSIAGPSLSSLASHFSTIKALDLSFTVAATENIIDLLSHLTGLKSLNLSNCKNVCTDRPILDFLSRLLNLQELSLENSRITNDVVSKLAFYNRKLRSLNLTDCVRITGECVRDFVFFGKLRELKLKHCHMLSTDSVEFIQYHVLLDTLVTPQQNDSSNSKHQFC